jgi:hypothetical protein
MSWGMSVFLLIAAKKHSMTGHCGQWFSTLAAFENYVQNFEKIQEFGFHCELTESAPIGEKAGTCLLLKFYL